MVATIHDLPPELIHQILSHLASASLPGERLASGNRGATPPSAFDQISIYGAVARTSRQLYELSAPFLYSSLTINAIVNNIGNDYWRHEPLAYHGIRDPGLQRQIRGLKEFIAAGDSTRSPPKDKVAKTRNEMCGYIKNVTLVFVNQQTTRPGLYRVPHCQACAMTEAEYMAAKPLAKADFDAYIAAMPAARASLGDLVSVLERLDGLETFAVLKRRNRENEPQWTCDPLELDGWVNVKNDEYGNGLEGLSRGMVRQIMRLSNLPTLRRLHLNCRLPPLVWAHNTNITHVKVKGVLSDPGLQVGGDGVKTSVWNAFRGLIEETRPQASKEGGKVQPSVGEMLKLEVMGNCPGGMFSICDGAQEPLSRVKAASFDMWHRGKWNLAVVETWLYNVLTLSVNSLEDLELSIAELPKTRYPDSVTPDSLPPLPLLRRAHVSFKTDLRRPRVWSRLAALLRPILRSAPNLSAISLEMIEPGQPLWDSAHCEKTLRLTEELDETLGDMFAQQEGLRSVKVRIEHNCSSTNLCEGRVAQSNCFQTLRGNGKEVKIALGRRY